MAEIEQQVEEVRGLIRDRLQIDGADLADQLRRAGRLLPRARRADGRRLALAAQASQHPRLSRQVDVPGAAAAAARLADHLRRIDPSDRRRTRVLGVLAVISFNLLILIAITLAVLAWRGFI